jgi:LuxR family maltose regulon positive regulatory protein
VCRNLAVLEALPVRTHTKSIYTKIGVNGRRAAVHRAEELALLSQPRAR